MRSVSRLLAFALLPTSIYLAHAAPLVPDAARPDAGQAIRDIQNTPLPLPPSQTLDLNLPSAPSTEVKAGGPTVQVTAFEFSGNTAFASTDLLTLLADLQNRRVSLGELQAGANRITLYYRERGYPLARAYLPAQEVDQGVVKIAVLEGHYGEVQVQNTAGIGGAALAPLAALKAGDAVHAEPLERSLLLLRDTPGVEVKSTLKPGATVGATDLVVDVQPGPRVSGSIDADNYGNRFTGEYRLGGTLNLNSPLGLGDQLTLRAMGSDEEQHYYRAAYQLPVGPWATQVGMAYSDMDYQLAKDFDDLDAHGNARITSAYLIQPLVRRRDLSLSAQLQFDDKRLKDDIDLFASKSDKRARVLSAALLGNSRDTWLGGGLNSFSLTWSQGSLTLDGQLEKLIDDLTAGSQGQFNKLNPSLVRLQRLTDRLSLYAQLQGQWSDSNLDSSEKLSLGGAYGVRAYPQGEASGDQGWLGNLELRYALTEAWQLSSFVDHGHVRLNKHTWADGENHRNLSAAGLGLSWAQQGWRINTVAAWKLGNAQPQSDTDRTPRVWAQVIRYF